MATTERHPDRVASLPRLGHLAALDGIRGVAVAIVVAHHLKLYGVHAGWLGVDLFFALSGFLITVSLLKDSGSGIVAFWRRRAWRLGPALAVFLGWYLVVSVGRTDEEQRFGWLAASAGQFLNVHDAASKRGPFSPHVGHLWSLSAEVQFYVVWPIVLVLLLRARASRAVLLAVPVALFVGSSVLRSVLEAQGTQWNRLYYGPDVRSTALWAGCVVGLLYGWGAFDRSKVLRGVVWALTVPAAVTIGLLVAQPSMNFSLGRTPYRWGLTVASVAALVLVAAGASVRGGPLRPLLEARPVEWLGRISFSVYLWHVPIIQFVRADPTRTTAREIAVILPATLVVATASYLLVERPLLSSAGRARLKARLARSPAPVG